MAGVFACTAVTRIARHVIMMPTHVESVLMDITIQAFAHVATVAARRAQEKVRNSASRVPLKRIYDVYMEKLEYALMLWNVAMGCMRIASQRSVPPAVLLALHAEH